METRFHNFSNCIFIFRTNGIPDTKIFNNKNKITNARTIRTVTEAGSKNWRSRGVNASCFINGPCREVLISKDSQGK